MKEAARTSRSQRRPQAAVRVRRSLPYFFSVFGLRPADCMSARKAACSSAKGRCAASLHRARGADTPSLLFEFFDELGQFLLGNAPVPVAHPEETFSGPWSTPSRRIRADQSRGLLSGTLRLKGKANHARRIRWPAFLTQPLDVVHYAGRLPTVTTCQFSTGAETAPRLISRSSVRRQIPRRPATSPILSSQRCSTFRLLQQFRHMVPFCLSFPGSETTA